MIITRSKDEVIIMMTPKQYDNLIDFVKFNCLGIGEKRKVADEFMEATKNVKEITP